MRQIWITRAGPPNVLQMREVSEPEPREGEVRIRVEACGVNFADLLARMGLYPDAPKIPCVVGYEVAGTVDAVGPGVTAFQPGQAVLALTHFQGYSEKVCTPELAVFARPERMSACKGAALLVNYLTAYQSLVVMGALREGNRVLIHSAAGGVGLAALDICRIYNATSIGTASAAKHNFLQERGIQHVIDYRTRDYTKEVERITGGEGVDIVLDSLGGPQWKKNYELLAPTGRLVCFGVSELAPGKARSLPAVLRFGRALLLRFSPVGLMNANKGVLGVNLAHLIDKPQLFAQWGKQLLAWYEEEKIAPHVDRVFPFEEAAAAHAYLHSRQAVGKVLLQP